MAANRPQLRVFALYLLRTLQSFGVSSIADLLLAQVGFSSSAQEPLQIKGDLNRRYKTSTISASARSKIFEETRFSQPRASLEAALTFSQPCP